MSLPTLTDTMQLSSMMGMMSTMGTMSTMGSLIDLPPALLPPPPMPPTELYEPPPSMPPSPPPPTPSPPPPSPPPSPPPPTVLTVETVVAFELGDLRDVASADIDKVKQQLGELYRYTGQDGTVNNDTDVTVTVTLYQILEASMIVTSSLSNPAVCDVFIEALTLDDFNATCTAAVSGDKYTLTLKYPLEPAQAVAAKTAAAKDFIVTSDFAEKMAAAAANQERRRLADLSVAGVEPPTTSVEAQVTIAVSVLGSDPDAYTALQVQSSALQAQAGSVDANMISNSLTAAVPNLAGDLAVTEPTQTVVETNAPPSTPPPQPPSPPPQPSPPPPSPPPTPPSSPPPSDDDSNNNLSLLALLALLVLLCPLCFVAYGCAFFGSKWKLYLRYRLSHSHPNLSIFYMSKEARDKLRTELYEPADLVTRVRTDNSEPNDKNDMAPNVHQTPAEFEENKA